MRILLKVVIGGASALCCACGETSTGPEPQVMASRTIRVPSQAATIQAALDASRDGDMILVSSGIYSGNGNRDIDFSGKSVTLISEAGPRTTTIDCIGNSSEPHFGILLAGGEDNAIIDGFTIRNGSANHGAAISMFSSSPTIRNCVFWNNHATVSGGAVRLKNSSAQFINCTFRDNSAPSGAVCFLSPALLQSSKTASSQTLQLVERSLYPAPPAIRNSPAQRCSAITVEIGPTRSLIRR